MNPPNPSPMSDDEILEHEFVVYDALYAECKRRVSKL
jgi:hypothetical protein